VRVQPPVVYRSSDEDSSRWNTFEAREGDVVISARSKHGTTWVQTICTMLVLQEARLPAPLSEISPWLDWRGEQQTAVLDRLAQQRHRRVVKTHTPLDGLPLDARVKYIVVARHPLDAAVSLYWQSQNLDRDRMRQLTGQPDGRAVEQPLPDWLRHWVEDDANPGTSLDSLAGVIHHVTDAWGRRESANVSLIHYYDLSTDLSRTMRQLASYLEVDAPQQTWSEMVEAASFDQMQADADRLAPDTKGILKSRAAFFRRAALGEGWALLDPARQRRYIDRVTALGSSELTQWINRPAE
jgi:aryl sulfotransferase